MMPTYEYKCPQCRLVQEHLHSADTRLSLFCDVCNIQLEWLFPCPHLHTETSLMGHLGDGFASDYVRKMAYRRARAAGINPTGKIYMTSLADGRGHADPDAWVPHSDFRSRVAGVSKQRGYSCQGTVNVAAPEPESDPLEEPYKVADDAIQPEVQQINEQQHGGQMTRKQKRAKHEELAEKYAGSL